MLLNAHPVNAADLDGAVERYGIGTGPMVLEATGDGNRGVVTSPGTAAMELLAQGDIYTTGSVFGDRGWGTMVLRMRGHAAVQHWVFGSGDAPMTLSLVAEPAGKPIIPGVFELTTPCRRMVLEACDRSMTVPGRDQC